MNAATTHRQHRPTMKDLVVELELDFSHLAEALDRMSRSAQVAATSLQAAFRQAARRRTERRAVKVAGLEARYWVRGGLDTRYATEEAISGLVRDIMAGRELAYFPALSYAERAQVASAALTGWLQGQGKETWTDCRNCGHPVMAGREEPCEWGGLCSPEQ